MLDLEKFCTSMNNTREEAEKMSKKKVGHVENFIGRHSLAQHHSSSKGLVHHSIYRQFPGTR
jgi:hypothetical protein